MDTKSIEKIVDERDLYLAQILEGVREGITEGVKEGVENGLKEGFKEGLKDAVTGNTIDLDFNELLLGILDDAYKTGLKEAAKNIVAKPAEVYMRSACEAVAGEVGRAGIELTEDDLEKIRDVVLKAENNILDTLSDKLPDNPFITDIGESVRASLEDSIQSELESCLSRLGNLKNDP